jgi:dynactin 5
MLMSRPPYKTYRGNFNYYPMKVGDHVQIGAGSVVEAATIGNHVEIGRNCIIVNLPCIKLHESSGLTALSQGKFTIIKDCAKIADDTVVPPNTVIPALSYFAGIPGTGRDL